MTTSNRVRLTGVAETTFGQTPANPRMLAQRVTSIGLSSKPVTVESDDIRDDRMNSDPTVVGKDNNGSIGIEWHYPTPGSLLDAEIISALCNDWSNTPYRDNDGVADSVIQAVDAATQVVTVAAGPAFVSGHLVRFTGFGTAANRNKLAKVTTGSATAPAFAGAGLMDEAVPAAAARMKVVGFEGVAGDIRAVADGLTSEAGGLDFTTLNLRVGIWLKVGDTGASYRFNTGPTNAWGRVVGIDAHKLTLDNLPPAWAADTGAGKTIRVFIPDMIVNGVGKRGVTLERGFMGQAVPTYIAQSGMRVNTLEIGGSAKQKAAGSIAFIGMRGAPGTVSLDSTPDPAPASADYPVMAFSANCGRIGYGGVALGNPNWASSIKIATNNNLRARDAVSDGDSNAMGPVDVEDGAFDVSVDLDTFFGNAELLQDLDAGVARAVNMRLGREDKCHAMVWEAPRLIARDGDPTVSGKNQDVKLPVKMTASMDPLTGVQLILCRFEFVR